MARKNSRASPPPHPPPRPPHKPHSKAHGTPRATAWCSAASFTVVLLALLAASLRPAPPLAPHRHLAAAAAEGDGAGGEACLNIAHLWDGRNATAPLGCEGFVRHYWEVAPRLSFAGAEFSNSLMRLGDIRSMLRTFRFRIHKNHGTVVLQEPGSGFLADRRWSRGDDVPADIVEIALREMRTLVLHNLEVYWPAVAAFTRDVVRFFHTYTQVNLYFSPAGLRVATSPHQDAHCVFIVQLHGAKRWHVHAPLSTQLTLKGLQRGKFGEILSSDDRALMGPALVNATLRPGSVLYVPRGFFHHTSTDPAALAAPGVFADASTHTDVAETREGVPADDGQPSMALTISVLSEDVYATWLHLLGEAVAQEEPFVGREEEREHLLLSLRRSSKGTPSAGPAGGAALRASLPRALLAPCERTARRRFTNPHAAWDEWRHAARDLLVEAWGGGDEGVSRAPPAWVASLEATDPLAERLDAVLLRKRTPCHGKLDQISAFLEATAGRTLDGRPQPDIDIDAIFQIEKRDKSYIPTDRRWFRPREW